MMMMISWIGAVHDICECERRVSVFRTTGRKHSERTYVKESTAEIDARDISRDVIDQLAVRWKGQVSNRRS